MSAKDPRFARLSTDPRFIRPSKASQKVVLDDRFKNLLSKDAEHADGAAKVDKYGRRVSKSKGKQALKAFYRLDEAKNKGLDRARGEGLIESSSEEDEEDEDEDEDESSMDDEGEEVVLGSKKAREAEHRRRRASSEVSINLDEDAPVASTSTGEGVHVESSIPTMQDATSRIAIVNLDWDNVRAVDIYKVFDSVLSPSASASLADGTGSRKSKTRIGKGRVKSVKIYPSEFGKARLRREETEGPPVEIFGKKTLLTTATAKRKGKAAVKSKRKTDHSEEDLSDEEDDGEEYDEQALRRYQLERLRYYYAIVEFDTPRAAQHAYEEIDSTEFEATANVFDLRYVPDDTTFDDQPTDTATATTVEVQAYKPAEFVTDALRNSKVKLTWDADDPQRMKLTRAAHAKGDKHEEVDYSALLASDSEDEGERRTRLREAYGFDAQGGSAEGSDDEGQDMQITFTPALSGRLDDQDDEDGADKDETSLETYQRKERERRQAKKDKRKAEKKKLAGHKGRLVQDPEDDSDPDEAFDANRYGEADGNDEDGQDAFFDIANGTPDENDDGSDEPKLSKKAAKQLERERNAKEAEALSLLVDEDDDAIGDGKHFDMQAILKAEKIAGKPKKSLKKGKDRRKHKEATDLLEQEKDRFEVDLQDDRFKNMHEDHEFALDPSNPKYLKTKNMQRLLDENRRRRDRKEPATDATPAAPVTRPQGDGLSSLVESIKRKSQSQSFKKDGKRQKRA